MTEELSYEVVRTFDAFELRRYSPHVVAEVIVRAAFTDAGSVAFGMLVGYISGQNATRRKVAMTAPVLQRASEAIAMTSPVEQRETGVGEYAVAFVLPSSYSLENAPEPTGDDVTLRERRATLAAVRRYRGGWSEGSYQRNRAALARGLEVAALTPVGLPRWARFNPPVTPWFLRRNEIVQDVEDDPIGEGAR